jgi:hypothetical protein
MLRSGAANTLARDPSRLRKGRCFKRSRTARPSRFTSFQPEKLPMTVEPEAKDCAHELSAVDHPRLGQHLRRMTTLDCL